MNQAVLPSRSQLQKAYECLQWQPKRIEPAELVLWSSWVRADPRLGELLVSFFAIHFSSINPYALYTQNLISGMPQALGVILSFAKSL